MLHLVPGDDLVGGGDEVGEGHNLSSLFSNFVFFRLPLLGSWYVDSSMVN